MKYQLSQGILAQTFMNLRLCGGGRAECQVLWLSPWDDPSSLTHVIHPIHKAHEGGFDLDTQWLSRFWLGLRDQGLGIRVQVHTHPGSAFHSSIDDKWPILHTTGFLSIVIPNFAKGPIGVSDAFLAERTADGSWHKREANDLLEIVCE